MPLPFSLYSYCVLRRGSRSFQPPVVHIAEDPLFGDQRFIAAGLSDPAPVKDEDLVAVLEGGQPMRDGEHRDPLLLEPLDLPLDLLSLCNG